MPRSGFVQYLTSHKIGGWYNSSAATGGHVRRLYRRYACTTAFMRHGTEVDHRGKSDHAQELGDLHRGAGRWVSLENSAGTTIS
jgi:hypothetical protein